MAGVDDTSAHGDDRSGSTDPHKAWLRAGHALQRAKSINPETGRRYRVAHPDPELEQRRRYRSANAEAIAASKARYIEANREHIREYRKRYNTEHLEEVRAKNREYMRQQADKRRRAAVQREKARERERRWAQQHPEQKRASIQRWKEAHPEKGAEYSRRYYERNREAVLARARDRRDANPKKVAAAARDWQQRNREHLTEWQRQYRTKPDAYARILESNRENKKLQRRLRSAGLPAKRVTRLPAHERRANEQEAHSFFERRRAADERKRMIADYEALDPHELEQLRRRSILARRRFEQLDRFGPAVDRFSQRADELREDARMDSLAGQLRGKLPLDLDAEVRQRVFDEADGDKYIAAGVSPVRVGDEIEQALQGHAAPAITSDGGRLIWVPAHTRSGRDVEGHWRRRSPG
ncbi:hypothetical protein ACPW96_21690 [Micromonospora sp. DT81.3]|uniref:hypothetical protein n=1 Tax=Micromonospora sp. DT81.3 TaxID=3416523 RepID=UPI003CFA703A